MKSVLVPPTGIERGRITTRATRVLEKCNKIMNLEQKINCSIIHFDWNKVLWPFHEIATMEDFFCCGLILSQNAIIPSRQKAPSAMQICYHTIPAQIAL